MFLKRILRVYCLINKFNKISHLIISCEKLQTTWDDLYIRDLAKFTLKEKIKKKEEKRKKKKKKEKKKEKKRKKKKEKRNKKEKKKKKTRFINLEKADAAWLMGQVPSFSAIPEKGQVPFESAASTFSSPAV